MDGHINKWNGVNREKSILGSYCAKKNENVKNLQI